MHLSPILPIGSSKDDVRAGVVNLPLSASEQGTTMRIADTILLVAISIGFVLLFFLP